MCRIFFIFLGLFTCIFLHGCATVQSRFQEVRQKDNIPAYNEFLVEYPNSPFTTEAKKRINELEMRQKKLEMEREYEVAKNLDTISSYEKFLREYPNSPYCKQISDRICEIEKRIESDWQKVRSKNTVKLYKKFLETYPNNKYAKDADARIIELESKEWDEAKKINTLLRYAQFLKLYPSGAYATDAKEAIKLCLKKLALETVENNSTKIQNGENFPLEILTYEEIKEAFAKTANLDVEEGYGYEIHHTEETFEETFWVNGCVIYRIPMRTLTADIRSSRFPDVVVTFYRDPTEKLSLTEKYNSSGVLQTVSIEGIGIAIIEKGGQKEVYEFNTPYKNPWE